MLVCLTGETANHHLLFSTSGPGSKGTRGDKPFPCLLSSRHHRGKQSDQPCLSEGRCVGLERLAPWRKEACNAGGAF